MNPTPYLTFQGNCREAMTAYVEIFNGQMGMMFTAAEMPDFDVPDRKTAMIAHATITVGDGEIYGSDEFMDDTSEMAGCSVMVSLPTGAQGKVAFDKLAEGGKVIMPYAPTFWAVGFGMVKDKFGIRWMISTDEEPNKA